MRVHLETGAPLLIEVTMGARPRGSTVGNTQKEGKEEEVEEEKKIRLLLGPLS